MLDTSVIFWASHSRLWHAIIDGESNPLCGKRLPIPRSTTKSTLPADDVRCARCDKLVWPDGAPETAA